MTAQQTPFASVAPPSNEGDAFARLARKVEFNMPLMPAEASAFTGIPRDTFRKMVSDRRLVRSVIYRGTGRERRHCMFLPKELLDELREQPRRK